MIPGLLAAAGYERGDTNRVISDIGTTSSVWNNSVPGQRNIILPANLEPSDSRWLIAGVVAIEVALSPQTTEITSILVNGSTCTNFNAISEQYNTDANRRIMAAMGVAYVPTGTTATVQITVDDHTNLGGWYVYVACVDFGINPPVFVYGSNNTPNGSGVLSVSDMGNKTCSLVLAAWEDSANTFTTATADVDPDGDGLTRRIVEQNTGNATPNFAYTALSMDGPPSESFPIELTPNTYTASDKAVIQYMTAHYT